MDSREGIKPERDRNRRRFSRGRSERPRDRKALAGTVAFYSPMVRDLEDEVGESDANPVLIYEEGRGLKIVDARIILKKKSS